MLKALLDYNSPFNTYVRNHQKKIALIATPICVAVIVVSQLPWILEMREADKYYRRKQEQLQKN